MRSSPLGNAIARIVERSRLGTFLAECALAAAIGAALLGDIMQQSRSYTPDDRREAQREARATIARLANINARRFARSPRRFHHGH
jgi:predicted anti-sigma-YlaC factor YlaD